MGNDPTATYLLYDGFIFCGTRFCIPICSLRKYLIHELYGCKVGAQVGQTKTIKLVEQKYF